MNHNDIENNFRYHAPSEYDIQMIAKFRQMFKELAEEIIDRVPDGREQSLAITKLEEAMMWTNAGIVRVGTSGHYELVGNSIYSPWDGG